MQPSPGNTQPKKNQESRVVRCPNCSHHNPPGQKFCGACGNPLQAQSMPRESVKPPVVKPRKSSIRLSTPVIVALITTIGAVLVALISSPLVLGLWGGGKGPVTVHVRVADGSGTAISNAKVTLFLSQGALLKYTDIDGAVTFENVESKSQKSADVIVEAPQFETANKELPVTSDQTLELRLSPPDPNNSKIFIRVVDAGSSQPVDGAKVELIVSGNNFVQSTDSNGIAPYKVSFFSSDNVDADLTVNSSNYNINRQRVSLLPNSVQDVRLSKDQAVVDDVALMQPTSTVGSISPVSSDPQSIKFGQTVTGAITEPGQFASYTFSAEANDAILIRAIGISGSLCAQVSVYGPDGKALSKGKCNVDNELFLPVKGKYKIIIGDGDVNFDGTANTGEFSLTLQKTNP